MAEAHLVTGGSGFIGLQLVKQLLEAGYTVHTTVRSLRNEAKAAPLKQLQAAHPGKLALFEADLLKPGSFGPAMAGCAVVHHIASPCLAPMMISDPQNQVLVPALEGTRNVLASVDATQSVRRVVLTSSAAAMHADNSDVRAMENGILSERYWNETSSLSHQPYSYAKTLAEKEAWKTAEAQSRWSMVAICPGVILGPHLAQGSGSGSLFLFDELLLGKLFYGVPDLSVPFSDVREVATAHVRAAATAAAHGRYIVARGGMVSFVDISKAFRRMHNTPILLPTWRLPTLLVRIVGPLVGLTQKFISGNFGIRFSIDNRRSVEELGVAYRPVEETLRDHYQSWLVTRNLWEAPDLSAQ